MIADAIKTSLAGSTILLTLLLAGCQSSSPPRTGTAPPTQQELQQVADKQCASAKSDQQETCRYLAKMQYGVTRNFYDANKYKGRECAATISYGQQVRYNVQSTAGDERLCLKVWSVISSATWLPAPPKNLPRRMVIDFKPL